MMTPANRDKVEAAQATGWLAVGTIYKRTRPDGNGGRAQRAEVSFDGVAGCLRTPVGGSSRQTIIAVKGPLVRTRLLSPREAARLMGLSDDFWLPDHYNSAYHVAVDGLVASVVRYLAAHLLEPLADLGDEAAVLSVEQLVTLAVIGSRALGARERRDALSRIVERYNDIVGKVETDPSLRIALS